MSTRLLVGVHNSSELFASWCLAVGEISCNMALLDSQLSIVSVFV